MSLEHGDMALPGERHECAYCGRESRDGEFVWLIEEGPIGEAWGAWSCADEDACHARMLERDR
jgi:hypothetical protein